MKIVKIIVFSLFGLLLINSGLNKFFQYLPVPEGLPEPLVQDNLAMMEISWLMPLVGAVEILGGLLILVPRTRALGVLMVFPVMVGMLLTHITVAPEGLPMAIVIWLIIVWMVIDDRRRFLSLVR